MDILQLILSNSFTVFVLIVIWLLQLYFHKTTKNAIRKIRKIFPPEGHEIGGTEDVAQIVATKGSTVYRQICTQINKYIDKNRDNIDLGIMKDTTNRITDKEFEEATSRIAFPMYIGLMGTYLGVGCGLGGLVYSMVTNNEDHMFDAEGIAVFIFGVIVAMATSFIGLYYTTVNNKRAAATSALLESQKDAFFNFLQTSILPQLPSTLAQTLKEELQRSIGALGTTIGALNTTVKSLNTELKATFEGITREFGSNLARNLGGIQQAVAVLAQGASTYSELMRRQDEVLDKLNNAAFNKTLTNIAKTAEKCVGLGDVLDEVDRKAEELSTRQEVAMSNQAAILDAQKALVESQTLSRESLVKLEEDLGRAITETQRTLNNITLESQEKLNGLVAQPRQMFEYIQSVLDQFKRIEKFVESFTANEFDSNEGRIQYIEAQIRAMEQAQQTVKDYLGLAESGLQKYLGSQMETITASAQHFIASWNDVFNEMVVNGQENPIGYLRQLADMNAKLDTISTKISPADGRQLYGYLEQIKSSLDNLSANMRYRNSSSKGSGNTTTMSAQVHIPKSSKPWYRRVFSRKR